MCLLPLTISSLKFEILKRCPSQDDIIGMAGIRGRKLNVTFSLQLTFGTRYVVCQLWLGCT